MRDLVQLALDGAAPAELFDAAHDELVNLGYDQVAYVNFAEIRGPEGGTRDRLLHTITYRDDWVAHYAREKYMEHDVLFRLAACNRRPVSWEDVRKQAELSRIEKRIFEEGYDAGHKYGTTIPFHAPGGTGATMSISTSGTLKDVRAAELRALSVTAQFHAIYDNLLHESQIVVPPPALSAREKECLSWVAAGKSNWDISQILSIAESTVNFHVQKAMRKLNVHSRIGAVLVASRFGQLQLA